MKNTKSRARTKRKPVVVYGLDDDGKRVKIVLIPPPGRGKIDPKVIEDAVRKVREEHMKARANGD